MKASSLLALTLAPLAALSAPIYIVRTPATVHHENILPEILVAKPAVVDLHHGQGQLSSVTSTSSTLTPFTPHPVLQHKWKMLPKEAWDALKASSIMRMEVGMIITKPQHNHRPVPQQAYTRPHRKTHTVPTNCHHTHSARVRSDRLIVLLVLSFFVIVVFVETASAAMRRMQRTLTSQGVIRLKEDAERQHLSVKADTPAAMVEGPPSGTDEVVSEKVPF